MDQIKIGRFIAERRKANNLTQMQLAELLNITDRAVSKWENGKSMPDSSIMLELCDILKITVNDLLCGEIVTMENYDKKLENNLLEMIKQKEKADKILLRMEILAGLMSAIPAVIGIVIGITIPLYTPIEEWKQAAIVLSGMIPLLLALPFLLRIEQVAGYYECKECCHKYVPTYTAVTLAPHLGRTRYMRCPKCRKRSWQKKILSKD